MKNIFLVEGMSCGHCVIAVKKELDKLGNQKIDVEIGKVTQEVNEFSLDGEVIIAAIEEAGYKVVEKKSE